MQTQPYTSPKVPDRSGELIGAFMMAIAGLGSVGFGALLLAKGWWIESFWILLALLPHFAIGLAIWYFSRKRRIKAKKAADEFYAALSRFD